MGIINRVFASRPSRDVMRSSAMLSRPGYIQSSLPCNAPRRGGTADRKYKRGFGVLPE